MNKVATSVVVLMASAVVGCGGGGGGGGSSGGGTSPTLSAFTSWSNVKPGERVVLTGDSQEASYTVDEIVEDGPNKGVKVDVQNFKALSAGAELTVGFETTGALNYVKLNTAEGTVLEFSQQNNSDYEFIEAIVGDILLIYNGAGTNYIFASDAFENEFEYQAFGTWTTGGGTGSGKIGDFSVGNATPVSNMPLSGNANYTGFSVGRFVDSDKTAYFTQSALLMNADFGTGVVGFQTNNTHITNELFEDPAMPFSSLDMNGTLNILTNTNQFIGGVNNSIANGNVNGRFYGPAANEIGGNFLLRNTITGVTYSGAFGGKR